MNKTKIQSSLYMKTKDIDMTQNKILRFMAMTSFLDFRTILRFSLYMFFCCLLLFICRNKMHVLTFSLRKTRISSWLCLSG